MATISSPASGTSPAESRTILWCVPRSGSTALTRCLSVIKDIHVWFEPFCYCNLAAIEFGQRQRKKLPVDYQGNEDTYRLAAEFMTDLTSSHFDPELLSFSSIKQHLEHATGTHVFIKDITNGNEVGYLPAGYRHTFLIRHPLRVLSSYRSAVFSHLLARGYLHGDAAELSTFDLEHHNPYYPEGFNFREIHTVWKYVRENMDGNPIVIDADDLLRAPALYVSVYCRAVGLPYQESLLKWDTTNDAVKTWRAPAGDMLTNIFDFYGTAMKSGGFLPAKPMPRAEDLPLDVVRCAEQVLPLYQEMFQSRMIL